jgi:type II secretory pathway pseudopilin PulG
MFSSAPTFSRSDLSSSLSAAKHRFKLHHDASRNKKTRARSEIATLLLKKQYDLAKIRAESLVTQQWQVEAEEVLSLMCELLRSRIEIISSSSSSQCPPELRESVLTLVFAAPRTEIDELKDVRTQLRLRYAGSADKAAFELAAKGDPQTINGVNQSVIDRLSLGGQWQTDHLFEKSKELLTEIAIENGISGFDANKDLADSKIGYGPSVGGSNVRENEPSPPTTKTQSIQSPKSDLPPQQQQLHQQHPDAVLPPINGYNNNNNNTTSIGSNWTITAPPSFNSGVAGPPGMTMQPNQGQYQQQQLQQQHQQQQSFQQGFPTMPSSQGGLCYSPIPPTLTSGTTSAFPVYTNGVGGMSSSANFIPTATDQPQFFIDPHTGQPHFAAFPGQSSNGIPFMAQGGGGGGAGMVMMMQYPPGAALSPFSPYMPLALPSSVLNGGVGGGGGGGVGGGPILLDATSLAQQQQQQMQLQLQLQQLQSQQLQQQQLHQFPPGFGTSLPSGGLINGSDGSKGVGGGGGGEGPVATQGFAFGGPTPSFPPCILSSSDTSLTGANIVSSTSSSTSSSSKDVSLDGVNPPSASASTTNTTLAPRSARSASFRRSMFMPTSVSRRDIFSDNGARLNEDDYDDDDGEDDSGNVKQVMPLQNPSQPQQHLQQQVQPSPQQAPSSSETSVSDLQKRLAALRS